MQPIWYKLYIMFCTKKGQGLHVSRILYVSWESNFNQQILSSFLH